MSIKPNIFLFHLLVQIGNQNRVKLSLENFDICLENDGYKSLATGNNIISMEKQLEEMSCIQIFYPSGRKL